ncbi:MAG TPA: glycosyltransferase family 2 protein, partial [Phormidium sp.]
NLYLLSIESILKIIVPAPTESALELQQASESSEGTTLAWIETRAKVHRILPSQVYERMRFNSLANRKPK